MIGVQKPTAAAVVKGILTYCGRLWLRKKTAIITAAIWGALLHFFMVAVVNEGYGGLLNFIVPGFNLLFPVSTVAWGILSFCISTWASYRILLIRKGMAGNAPSPAIIFLCALLYFLLNELMHSQGIFADDQGLKENGGIFGYFINVNSYPGIFVDIFSGLSSGFGWVIGGDMGEQIITTIVDAADGSQLDEEKKEKIGKLQDEIDYHRKEAEAWRRKLAETTDPKSREEIQRRILTHDDAASRFNDEITAIRGDGIVHHTTTEADNLNKKMMEDQGKKMAADLAEKKRVSEQMLANLSKMQKNIIFGAEGTDGLWKGRGQPGDVNTQIDAVINDLISGKGADIEKYNKIARVYNDSVTGKTSPESAVMSDSQITSETIKGTVEKTAREVSTFRDSDGNMSWKAVGVRLGAAVVTFGKSEMVFTPAKSVYTMKDYIDSGGDSAVVGTIYVASDILTGHTIGAMTSGGVEGVKQTVTDTVKGIKDKITRWTSSKGAQAGDDVAVQGFKPGDVSGHGPGSGAGGVSLEAINRGKNYRIFQKVGDKLQEIPYSSGVEDMKGVVMIPKGGLADSIVQQQGKVTMQNVIVNGKNARESFQLGKMTLDVLDAIY
jgi:DNA-binding transcriptional regulator YbjK